MAELAETLGVPTEITLKGHLYKLEKLTLGDWAEFERIAKKKHRENVLSCGREVYGDELPDEVFQTMIRPLTEDELEQYQSSIEGITFLLWKSLVKRKKDITLEQAADLVTLDDITEVTAAILGASAKNVQGAETEKS